MIGFSYSLKTVDFRAILMSFLTFFSQKTNPAEFLRQEVILSKGYRRKCSIWSEPLAIINLLFFKNATKSDQLMIISIYLPEVKNLKKINGVACLGWFNMELPNEEFSPLSNRWYDHSKNVFYPFLWQQLSRKHTPSSKSCNLFVQTMIEKMESSR